LTIGAIVLFKRPAAVDADAMMWHWARRDATIRVERAEQISDPGGIGGPRVSVILATGVRR
jgi:hypothetical protein